MSCHCGSNPCLCIPSCPETCPEIIDYEASNINLAGIGVYDSQSGNEFRFRGFRSTDGAITIALNDTFHTIDLTVTDLELIGTKVFTNAANRALTIPAFEGQLGVQTDTDVIYYSTGLAAGNWSTDFTFLSGKTTTMATGTIVQVADAATVTVISPTSNSTWDFENLDVNFDNCDVLIESDSLLQVNGLLTAIAGSTVQVDGAFNATAGSTVTFEFGSTFIVEGDSLFNGSTTVFTVAPDFQTGLDVTSGSLTLSGAGILNFGAGGTIALAGVAVAAASVVTTAAAGVPSSKLINTFISTTNTQTGYTAFTNPVTRRTCDTTTVTLPELAQLVGTLIADLKLVKLPAT